MLPHPVAGDDLIGPRDIKRGVHLLTNAEIAILNTDEPPEEEDAPDEQSPAAGATLARMATRRRRKRRDSAALRGEKLSEEQLTQVPRAYSPSIAACHQYISFSGVLVSSTQLMACSCRYMSEWPTRLILRALE